MTKQSRVTFIGGFFDAATAFCSCIFCSSFDSPRVGCARMSAVDIFGWLGTIVLVVSLLQSRMLRLRIINLIAALMLIAFNAMVEVWPMVGMNVAVALIDLYFLVKMYRDWRTGKKELVGR